LGLDGLSLALLFGANAKIERDPFKLIILAVAVRVRHRGSPS
jgi:hypothetical protein